MAISMVVVVESSPAPALVIRPRFPVPGGDLAGPGAFLAEGQAGAVVLRGMEEIWSSWVVFGRERKFILDWAAVDPAGVWLWIDRLKELRCKE